MELMIFDGVYRLLYYEELTLNLVNGARHYCPLRCSCYMLRGIWHMYNLNLTASLLTIYSIHQTMYCTQSVRYISLLL